MTIGWTAGGMLAAEDQFRRIVGSPGSAVVHERDLAPSMTSKEVATLISA